MSTQLTKAEIARMRAQAQLRRSRGEAARPQEVGLGIERFATAARKPEGILDTLSALFNPSDPRLMAQVGPVQVKAPLALGSAALGAIVTAGAAGAVPATLGGATLATGARAAGGFALRHKLLTALGLAVPATAGALALGGEDTGPPPQPTTQLEVDAATKVEALLERLRAANTYTEAVSLSQQIIALLPLTGPRQDALRSLYINAAALTLTPLQAAVAPPPEPKEGDRKEPEPFEIVEIPGLGPTLVSIGGQPIDPTPISLFTAEQKEVARRAGLDERRFIAEQEQAKAAILSGERKDFLAALQSPSQTIRLAAMAARQRGLAAIPKTEQTGVLKGLFPALGGVNIPGQQVAPGLAGLFQGLEAGQAIPLPRGADPFQAGLDPAEIGVPAPGAVASPQFAGMPRPAQIAGLTPSEAAQLPALMEQFGQGQEDLTRFLTRAQQTAPRFQQVGTLSRR